MQVDKQQSDFSVSFLIEKIDPKDKEECFEQLFEQVEFASHKGIKVDFDIMTDAPYATLKDKSSKDFVMIVNPKDTQKPWRLLISWLITKQDSSNGAYVKDLGFRSAFFRNNDETREAILFTTLEFPEFNETMSDIRSFTHSILDINI